jgi:hypothetical protein
LRVPLDLEEFRGNREEFLGTRKVPLEPDEFLGFRGTLVITRGA